MSTNAAYDEEPNEDIQVEFNGYPEEKVYVVQAAYGLNPTFVVEAILPENDGDPVVFDAKTYGTNNMRGFLSSVQELIGTLLERLPEDGDDEPDAKQG